MILIALGVFVASIFVVYLIFSLRVQNQKSLEIKDSFLSGMYRVIVIFSLMIFFVIILMSDLDIISITIGFFISIGIIIIAYMHYLVTPVYEG